MFQAKSVEKIKTHFVSSIYIAKNRAVYEIMWKNIVNPDRPNDNVIRRMRFSCRITKATNTHSEYVTLFFFFSVTVVERTRLNVTLHVHCLSCFGFLNGRNGLTKRYHLNLFVCCKSCTVKL
jgi:hypothetical protein